MKKNKGSGILFVCGDKVLLLQNNKGIWEIPGGKKEPDENYLETAKRETWEEIGKCPTFLLIGKYLFLTKKNKFKIYIGLVKNKFTCLLSDEHERFEWFDVNDLPQPLHAKVAGALDMLKKHLSTCDNVDAI